MVVSILWTMLWVTPTKKTSRQVAGKRLCVIPYGGWNGYELTLVPAERLASLTGLPLKDLRGVPCYQVRGILPYAWGPGKGGMLVHYM